ncbi:Abi family protein [Bengtsoniella intestinalis]|uniref:Abi family protein n=1 Tax=Bengtsoniella intestinalis TaxID=3073143 RepID=UPI00391F301A
METTFLTYQQQLDRLHHEKNIACDTVEEHTLLRRVGYFNLVHGYRGPFLDHIDSCGSGVYVPETQLRYLGAVKDFDDALRQVLFQALIEIEEEVRTFAAYAFGEHNSPDHLDWRDPASYATTTKNGAFRTMLHRADREVDQCDFPYVRGYLKRKELVPAFVMAKVVYLFTFILFLDQCQAPIKDRLCHLYGLYDENGRPDHPLLIESLHWMRQVRNVCAHNERLFTYDGATRGLVSYRTITGYTLLLPPQYHKPDCPKQVLDYLMYCKYYMDDPAYQQLLAKVQSLLATLEGRIPTTAFYRVLQSMGLEHPHHIASLQANPKRIDYHRF